jgi:hypothetical protein
MMEMRVKRVENVFIIQAYVDGWWRSLLRACGLRFIRSRPEWRTMRRVTDNLMPEFSPYGTGYVLEFESYEEAAELVERYGQGQEHKKKMDALP